MCVFVCCYVNCLKWQYYTLNLKCCFITTNNYTVCNKFMKFLKHTCWCFLECISRFKQERKSYKLYRMTNLLRKNVRPMNGDVNIALKHCIKTKNKMKSNHVSTSHPCIFEVILWVLNKFHKWSVVEYSEPTGEPVILWLTFTLHFKMKYGNHQSLKATSCGQEVSSVCNTADIYSQRWGRLCLHNDC